MPQLLLSVLPTVQQGARASNQYPLAPACPAEAGKEGKHCSPSPPPCKIWAASQRLGAGPPGESGPGVGPPDGPERNLNTRGLSFLGVSL